MHNHSRVYIQLKDKNYNSPNKHITKDFLEEQADNFMRLKAEWPVSICMLESQSDKAAQ